MTKMNLLTIAVLGSCALACKNSDGANDSSPFSKLHGPYLGQGPPGLTPKLFAQGLISTQGDEAGLTVSPAGDEVIFWTVEPREGDGGPKITIQITREENGSWTDPRVAPFAGPYKDMYPALSPDGNRLFFQSDRPVDSTESTFDYNIWYVDREGEGWSEPRSIGRPINGLSHTGGASATADGTLYYTVMNTKTGESKLYRSEYANGSYQEPQRLPENVNAFYQTTDSYVDPEDRYLIFMAFERQGHENNPGDLFVAFRGEDGSWSDAVRLDPTINSEDQFGSVTISADGRYLFFIRVNDELVGPTQMGWDLYWVDAALVSEMR